MYASGSGAPIHPTILLTFLSIGNEYQIDNEQIVPRAIRTIQHFQYKTGDSHSYPELVSVKSISTSNGIIIVSGNSATTEHLDDDSGCCPSYHFVYQFNCYMDNLGKVYAKIAGTYTNERKGTEQTFKIDYTEN
jgi:hypothetical protein